MALHLLPDDEVGEHDRDDGCWCQPELRFVHADDGTWRFAWVHDGADDGPDQP